MKPETMDMAWKALYIVIAIPFTAILSGLAYILGFGITHYLPRWARYPVFFVLSFVGAFLVEQENTPYERLTNSHVLFILFASVTFLGINDTLSRLWPASTEP